MTEKQEHLLQLFRELDEICKKNNLRYVMAGGTAIGVVRNEGFIPWDDDVDIYMPRDDWNKLVEISGSVLPEHRALQCVDVDRSYTNTFPRYVATDSCALHKHQIIGRTVPVRKKLEKIMYSYKEEDCPRYAMRWGGCPFLFDKDMMFPVKYMNFENTEVMVPHRMSDYLIWHYGDEWSYIPPHGERESHDAVTVEGITYKELRDDYLPGIRKGRLRRDSIWRKIYSLAGAKRNHRLQYKRNLLLAKSTVMDLEARISESRHSLKELVEKRDFSQLNEIFTKYYQVQLSSAFIGREDFGGIYAFYHPVLLEVSDVTFYAAMLTLVYTERIGKAWRMLVVKEQTGTFPSELAQLKSDIELFRRAVCDYEFKRYQEAEDTMVPLMERYPEVPGFVKFKSRFLMERARNGIDMVEAELYIDEALRLFPEDGYFLKYQGELLWMKGKCADALEVFADAREKTNNGITQLELDKFLNPYGRETVKTCQQLLDVGQKDGAMKLMALWYRLLPENPSVREYYYLARASVAKKRSEVELTDFCCHKDGEKRMLDRRIKLELWYRLLP